MTPRQQIGIFASESSLTERRVVALSRQLTEAEHDKAKGVALLCVTLASSVDLAAAGEFDPSFNRVGFTRDHLGGPTVGLGLAIHSTDEIVTAGHYSDLQADLR